VFILVAHLVADILYAILDPRIRYWRGEANGKWINHQNKNKIIFEEF
jgi:hypothetical protein